MGGGILSLKNPKNVLAPALKSRFNKPKEKHNKSFTLAEVLISLVIIGIIAAITVPMIMQNHKRIETAAKLKKFYSNMSNAIKLSELDNGTPSCYWEPYLIGMEFFDKYFANYIRYTKVEEVSTASLKIYLDDGTTFDLNFAGPQRVFIFDVNGDKKPNEIGKDEFMFLLWVYGYTNNIREQFDVYRTVDSKSREELIQLLKKSCTVYGNYSAWLVQMDGWEFKNDYPCRL